MDKDQRDIKNELIDEHEELQIKDELNDQGFILSTIENIKSGTMIKKSTQNPKQFVKSETITIQTYSKSKPSDAFSSMAEIKLPSKNEQGRTEMNSQKLIKTFLKTDQGMVLIGKSTFSDMTTSATSNQTSTKPLIPIKTEPENVAESGIFVKSETDIKPEIFSGRTESDLHLKMSSEIKDPLDIAKVKKVFHCPICLKSYTSKRCVENHVLRVHETSEMKIAKPIQCFKCPTRFGFKGEFNRHFVNVHGGKGLKNKIQNYNVHEKNKPIQCTSCPIWFVSKNDLQRHFTKAHEGEEINCQETTDINNLKGHQDNSEIILPD